ncbi:MAG: hypothetical protein WBP75_06610 [Candidatus Cybelea sp.]|jgi:hypothetical protein
MNELNTEVGEEMKMLLRGRLSLRSICSFTAVTGALALLAGCGGSQPQMTPQGFAQGTGSAASHSLVPAVTCPPTDGGVSVTPCRVELNASNPGPIALTVSTPNGSKGTLKEHDLCGALGIATVSGSGDSWSVTAGSTAGKCRISFAYFNNGKKVGWARAVVTNSI